MIGEIGKNLEGEVFPDTIAKDDLFQLLTGL